MATAETTTHTEWTAEFRRMDGGTVHLGIKFRTREDLQRYIRNEVAAGVPAKCYGAIKSRTVTTITSPWEVEN